MAVTTANYLLIFASCLLIQCVNTDPNYRLNTPLRPSAYSIVITPYFDTGDERAFTFDGEVTITFTTESAINQIKIHSENLTFVPENITVTSGNNLLDLNYLNPLEYDTFYTFTYINMQINLQAGVEYVLRIAYTGPIRNDLNGFYRNYYIENGVRKWLGATQMEPTHARKVFPCFDEPALKATFALTIDRPEGYKPSLANTKLQSSVNLTNGYVREVFYPTPRMSTYLVAFLVSEFETAQYNISSDGTKEFGIFTRPQAVNQSEYAFDFGLRVVQALGDYFGVDYYSTNEHLKLDHVALINFRAGAMENWGLVTYRESLLLYVPEESLPYYKYRVAQILAHETAHMWFGNLVTCHWWSNTWLNEGFANYFQDYITSLIEPEVASGNILVTGSVYAAYDADESPTSSAITNDNVFSPAEISGHFGAITYQKAGSVIRMIHHLIGDGAFRVGLNAYLTANEFQPGYPDLLYAGLQAGVSATNGLAAYPGATVADVMGSWISQAGHPVLDAGVDYENNIVTLNQRRFYINGSHSSNEIYKIPITFTTGVSPDFENTKPSFVMENQSLSFNVTDIGLNHSWVIVNVQESGLYRVKYDDHAYQIIGTALKGSERDTIHHLNRAKIVNDLFAFFYADEVYFGLLYNIIDFLREETDYSVWYAGIKGLNKLRNIFQGSDASHDIDTYILDLLENIINHLGYEEKDTDDFETLRNRMQVLELACKLGHAGCIERTNALFRNFVDNGVTISPSLRPVAYCTGLRHVSADDYGFLWERMASTNVANEARLIGEILGCTTDEDILKIFLVSMLEEDSPIMAQDLTVPLTSVLGNHSHVSLVIEELKQNLSTWSSIYPSMDTVYTSIASALRTDEEIDEFEDWLQSCEECGNRDGGLSALSQGKAVAQWARSHMAEVLSSLRNSAAITTTFTAIIALSLIVVWSLD